LVMPSFTSSLFGVELVSVTPSNAETGRPVTQGIMILLDGQSGAPLAMLDAGALTAERTGAVAAMAIRLLADPDTETLGLIGCGTQGAWIVIQVASPLTRQREPPSAGISPLIRNLALRYILSLSRRR
jgi:ornithine cyclodeaminase